MMNKILFLPACSFLFFCNTFYGQFYSGIQFKHVSVSEGLSASNVNCIYQDREGFMWFGTVNGLNKYDGYSFTVYKSDPSELGSITGNIINDIAEDDSANLWIASSQGLSCYHRKQNNFTNYLHDKAMANTISDNVAQCLLLDDDQQLWIGTGNGLSKFNQKTARFTNYTHKERDDETLANNDVTSIIRDHTGKLWIGTRGGGMDLLDTKSGKFSHHINPYSPGAGVNTIQDLYEDSGGVLWVATGHGLYSYDSSTKLFTRHIRDIEIRYNVIVRIAEDSNGDIWVGTENDGLYIRHKATGKFENLRNTPDVASLSNNSIYSIYRDRQNNMWVGTYTGAINIYDAHREKFIHFKNITGDNSSLNNNSVVSFAPDGAGAVWIGTDGGGLNHFVRAENKFTHYLATPGGKGNSILGNHVGGLLMDSKGDLWSTSWGEGINLLPKNSRWFTSYRHQDGDNKSVASNYGFETYEDRQGNEWIGTMGAGMDRLNNDGHGFTHYAPSQDSVPGISSKFIYSIFEDNHSNLWVGTEDFGLNLFDRPTGKCAHYFHQPNNPRSLSNNTVNVIFQDKNSNLWVGTNSGLNKFNYNTGDFDVYLEKQGLPGGVVKSIEQDSEGNLWLGTTAGISKFNPASGVFRTYTADDGLQGNEFNRQSSYRAPNGEMYFGGNNGFNTFFPDSIVESKYVAPVAITDFLIFNKSYPIGKQGSPLTVHINETNQITLSYKESVFSIAFAALDFIHPGEVQYAYRLQGFDKQWNYVGNSRMATYTHMDPGNYVFYVKACNSNGNWGQTVKSLKITIVPPFWATFWFRLVAIIFIAVLIAAFFQFRLYSLRKQKQVLEQKVIEKNASLQSLVIMQDKLLNEKNWLIKEIHHRVKNNLHMIAGLLNSQSMYLASDEAVKVIHDSQRRVDAMSLIHQKLYQSENLSVVDMSVYIHELAEYLQDSFNTRQRIHFELQIERINMDVSYSIPIGLILNESITNAIKYAFTPDMNGTICISLHHKGNDIFLLCITDDGVGIAADFDATTHRSMGMNLMTGLSGDIGGDFSIKRHQGTQIHISFSYQHDAANNIVSTKSS